MSATYKRNHPRDPYEAKLVETLVAIGYQVRLASDFEDEILGIDAYDTEFGIAIDFHVGPINSRYYAKLAKEASGKIHIFHLDLEMHDTILFGKCNRRTLEKLGEVYQEFLDQAIARTRRRIRVPA